MRIHVVVIACAAALAVVSGCASIMQGSEQRIGITSTPSGANVTVDGNPVGITPVVASMKRESDHLVQITMDGYVPYQTFVTRSVSGAVAGNVLAGGLIGAAVDKSTGAMYKLTPASIDAVLVKADTPSAVTAGATAPARFQHLSAVAEFFYPVNKVTSTGTGGTRHTELIPGETGHIVLTVGTTASVPATQVSARVVGHYESLSVGPSLFVGSSGAMVFPTKMEKIRIPVTFSGTTGDTTTTIRAVVLGSGVTSDTVSVDVVTRMRRVQEGATR